MATILPSYDWTFISKHTPKARSRNYPWDEWLDGRIRELTQGEDFDGPAVSMERVIRTSANRKRIKVRVRITEDETIVLQSHDDATGTSRGVTKSLSARQVKANKAAAAATNGEVAPAKATAKRVTKAVKAPARPKATTAKAPARKRVAKPATAKASKRVKANA